MLLHKTARAREALQAGPNGGLSLQERRILIMTDGRRSLNDVMALLGADILPVIDRLIRGGYIDDGRGQPPSGAHEGAPRHGLGGALGGLIRAATESVQARTEQIRATAAASTPLQAPPTPSPASTPSAPAPAPRHGAPEPAAAARGGQRRSLVAAKMYIVDMLQLQRHPDAVDLKARIQVTSGQAELLEALLDGMRVLLQLTSESYGQRIVARLGEVLPEELLPALDAALAAWHAADATPERSAPPQLKIVGG